MSTVVLKKLIDAEIAKQKGSSVSVFFQNKQTGKSFSYNENVLFGTASIIKVAIALTLFKKSEDKLLDVDKLISLQTKTNLGKYNNGVFSYLQNNSKVTLRLACLFMLKLSDNMATNVILEYVTKDEINTYLNSIGLVSTKLTADILDPTQLEKEENYLGVTTAKEMAELFERITLRNLLLSQTNLKALQKMLEADYPGKTFDRYLPTTWNVSPNRIKIKKIYAKDGAFPLFELRSDAFSLITNKNEIISCAIFTKGIINSSRDPYPTNLNADHPANLFIAKLAKEIFDQLY